MSAFKPDFSHRLTANFDDSELFTMGDLTDSLLIVCERAEAIIAAVSCQFDGSSDCRLPDSVNAVMLDAAANEVKDIAALLMAYHKQNKP